MNEKQLNAFFEMLEECAEEDNEKHGIFINYKNYWKIANKLEHLLPTWVSPPCDSPPDRILCGDEVRKIVNIAKTSFYRLISEGQFPQPITVPGFEKSPGWRLSDVMNWLESPEIWSISNQVAVMSEQDEKSGNEERERD